MEALQIIENYGKSNIENEMEKFDTVWRNAYGVSGCSTTETIEAKIIRIETASRPIELVEAFFLTYRDKELVREFFHKIKKTKTNRTKWTNDDWKIISDWSCMMGLGDLGKIIRALDKKERLKYWAKKSQ